MALVSVRSKQPVNGEHIESVVDESWLERWPDDWDRIDPAETPAEPAAEAPIEDALDATVADEPTPAAADEAKPSTKTSVAIDPTVSSD